MRDPYNPLNKTSNTNFWGSQSPALTYRMCAQMQDWHTTYIIMSGIQN